VAFTVESASNSVRADPRRRSPRVVNCPLIDFGVQDCVRERGTPPAYGGASAVGRLQ